MCIYILCVKYSTHLVSWSMNAYKTAQQSRPGALLAVCVRVSSDDEMTGVGWLRFGRSAVLTLRWGKELFTGSTSSSSSWASEKVMVSVVGSAVLPSSGSKVPSSSAS